MLTITSNGGALNVPVRVEGLPPKLAVTPQTLDFVIPYQRRVAPQPLVIENLGAGLLTGTVHADAAWLKIRDDVVHSNHLETLVAVDVNALERGATVVSTVHIATNGGEVDVPVTVRKVSSGLLGRSIRNVLFGALVTVMLIAIMLGAMAWQQGHSLMPATPPPIYTKDGLSVSPATSARNPTAVHSPSTAPSLRNSSPAPAPSSTATPAPSFTVTPAPPTITSLQVIERLRTLVAQRAGQTAVATVPAAPTTSTGLPIVTTPKVTLPSAQCVDTRAVITSPFPGQTLRGAVPVYGTAEHAAFRYYKLEIAPKQDVVGRFSFVVDSDVPVISGLLAVIDTTRFDNGVYILQLTVVDRSGNVPSPCQVVVNIDN